MAVEGEVVTKAKMGRPSKLTPEIVKQAWDWLEYTSNVSIGTLLPTVEGLAIELGTHRSTLQEWEKDNKDFSAIMDKLRSAQAEKLIQNALQGRYNPTIAKLLLSKHGYVEKQELDTNLTVVQPIIGGLSKKQIDDGLHPNDND